MTALTTWAPPNLCSAPPPASEWAAVSGSQWAVVRIGQRPPIVNLLPGPGALHLPACVKPSTHHELGSRANVGKFPALLLPAHSDCISTIPTWPHQTAAKSASLERGQMWGTRVVPFVARAPSPRPLT